MDVRIREARPDDAYAVAALHLQDDLEQGATSRQGFLDEFVDAWLADTDRHTWLATDPTGRPLGVVHGIVNTPLPSLRRPRTSWMHVSLLYVAVDARGHGLGERLMGALLGWCEDAGVHRVQLGADAKARTLYERSGFRPAQDRLMQWHVTG